MAASEGVTSASRSRELLANQLLAHPLRTAPEKSRVRPFAFARLRIAVSLRPCWRPIQARAISSHKGSPQKHRIRADCQTVFEAVRQP